MLALWAGYSTVEEYGGIPSADNEFATTAFTGDLMARLIFMPLVFIGIPSLIVWAVRKARDRSGPRRGSFLQVLAGLAVLAVALTGSALLVDANEQAEAQRLAERRDQAAQPVADQLEHLIRLLANCPNPDEQIDTLLAREIEVVEDEIDDPLPPGLAGEPMAATTYFRVKGANEQVLALLLGVEDGAFSVEDAFADAADFLGVARVEEVGEDARRGIPTRCFP